MFPFSSPCQTSIEDWTKTPWKEINVEQMDMELRRFAKVRQLFTYSTVQKEMISHFSWDIEKVLNPSIIKDYISHIEGDEDAG